MQPCEDSDRFFEKFPELRGAGDLISHFHLTLEQAAKTREVSVSGLKRICREHVWRQAMAIPSVTEHEAQMS